jgi:hypothetical protein
MPARLTQTIVRSTPDGFARDMTLVEVAKALAISTSTLPALPHEILSSHLCATHTPGCTRRVIDFHEQQPVRPFNTFVSTRKK